MLKICVIGLGYVGLPICLKLSNSFKTIGFDISKKRVNTLTKGQDINNEYSKKDLIKKNLKFSFKIQDTKDCNFFIICVPTPINNSKLPDLSYIEKSFNLISKIIKKDDIIVLESTVYPGVTERFTKKLENKTNLKNNKDINICYSPERINPGDKKKNLNNIKKILAYEGSNKKIKIKLNNVYKKISKKIIFSKNIKEAETAKGIENIQRDLNIALFNEILIICNKLNLNFNEVIRLASTKWNFLNFNPGLVGGHCLPVDPYYLTYIANKNGYKSKVSYQGKNCVYCQASANLISINSNGKGVEEMIEVCDCANEFFRNNCNLSENLKKYKELLSSKNINRKECILLPFNALKKGLINGD